MSGVLTLLAGLTMLTLSSQSVTTSTDAIAQALAAGRRSEDELPLAPYSVKHHYGRSRGPNVAIYTPYLRVALASRTAHAKKKTLTPVDLPEWITSADVLVIFRSPCPPGNCTYETLRRHTYTRDMAPALVYSGPMMGNDDPNRPRIPASNVVRELAFLEVIGGQPFEEAVLAATFPLEAIQPGISLVARWDFEMDSILSGGQITVADAQGWRYR